MSATVLPTPAPIPSRDEVLSALMLTAPPAARNTYELALVMGGTVSSGAYTAGAMDFLIEALDCFQAAKTSSGSPYHNVVLKALSGTSGGGVIAAILARALAYKFPPQFFGAPAIPAGDPVNPLYDTWVNKLDLTSMLQTNDIVDNAVPSLLNADVIDQAAAAIENYTGNPLYVPRDWVGAPLTLFMTHTNLSGVPIEIDFGGGQYQRFIEHADYVRFAVSYPGQLPYANAKPYEFALTFPSVKPGQDEQWKNLGLFACASSAFPIGFPTRHLDRPLAHYYYRVLSTAINPITADDLWVVQADWTAMLNNNGSQTVGNVRYSAVDGGVANNEPIELARTALCGLLGRNARGSADANRAVWLIDPFAGETDMAPFSVAGIFDAGVASLNASLQQGRYSTADLVLAVDPNIYSRYMLSAHHNGVSGGKALATAGLSAFMGFACIDFRRYDYYLGRKNCQDFLLNTFRQSKDNPVFSAWTAAQIAAFVDSNGDLPIIPLFGSAAEAESLMPWPKGALDPDKFTADIDNRFRAILGAALPGSFWGRIVADLAGFFAQTPVSNYIIAQLKQALQDWGLS